MSIGNFLDFNMGVERRGLSYLREGEYDRPFASPAFFMMAGRRSNFFDVSGCSGSWQR